ncbi:S24 family peptidase [Gluconacetobacter entanii]|uniref:LexA family protein n=1 Tax=Gluconacetobacter entanii TaxID=108528 RepID=UPI001C9345E9|nr:S24 family peptidase [Gluconacetobacter entanii]MBY4640759.1 S24 family peptidase [Gluconacetobacter entanii]MCW4581214.1 S24 family peptidase [Gluconacetobacter entanii]MCW4584474.1 S24 family peptidase [Gluconacetobacter entanii]MCW4587862.1 S24 family peptidase [Gluconacetobacter entanii]
MSMADLLAAIDARLKEHGLSDRGACVKAHEINPAVGVDFIRDMRRRGHPPKADKLGALAQVLGVSPQFFVAALLKEGADTGTEKQLLPAVVEPIEVRGFVQAGAWRSALEIPVADRYEIMVPTKGPYSHLPRYGLEVRGDSMNKFFPNGTVVEVVNFSDIGRAPETGECVVVIRRDGPEMEATLKLYQLTDDGNVVLWPKSTDPQWQQPIRLCHISDGQRHYRDFGDRSDGSDTETLALVIGAHLPIGKFPIT